MRVNRKAPYIIALLLTCLFILHACTSSSFTSISGKLSIVTLEGSGGESESSKSSPYASLKLPDELITEALIHEMQMSQSSEPEFVPDEIIVKYRPGIEPLALQSLTTSGGFTALRTSRNVSAGSLSVLKLARSESSRLSIDAVRDRTLREIDRLDTLSHIEYAQPNYIYKPLSFDPTNPSDEHYSMQWHYQMIKWDHLWDEDLVPDISGVIVAVIDTGIVRSNGTKSGLNHEDFIDGSSQSPFVDEYDFISDADRAFDGDGYDNDATDVGDNPTLELASFHGTHVIGTIGAYTNNSIGVAGIAGREDVSTNVKIMPLRALGYGGGTTADIIEAINYAAQLPNATGKQPSQKADVINLSLGGTAQDQALEDAINAAYAEDIVIVAAAGNTGTPVPFYPAAYSNVISVSAVDIGAQVTSYSNFGDTIDLAAPGGDLSRNLNFDIDALRYADGILSTFTDSSYDTQTYIFYQGTSMAAPHVAGVAALIKAKTGLSAEDIVSRIKSTALDLGAAGKDDYYGHGLINAYAAVSGGPGANAVLFPYPKLFKFMGENPSGTFTLKNIGNTAADITINNIVKENDASWLSLSWTSPSDVGAGLPIDLTIDSSSIMDGNDHIEMLTIKADQTTVGDEYVYVLYNVNGFLTEQLKDIGPLYVVAIDIKTTEIVGLVQTTFSELYSYDIYGIPAGSYIIGASTDRDRDYVIFESDDAYGYYMSIDQIVVVDVSIGTREQKIDFDVIDKYDNPSSQCVR